MATYIIHNGSIILNRVKADDVITVNEGEFCVEAIGVWDGYIGQGVDTNGIIPDIANPPTLEEQLEKIQTEHYATLESVVYDFTDGRVIQTRPSDLNNFKEALGIGRDRKWLMIDNIPYFITIAELQTAYDAGRLTIDALWDKLMTDIETLMGV